MLRGMRFGMTLTAILLIGSLSHAQKKPAHPVVRLESSDPALIDVISGPGWYNRPVPGGRPAVVYYDASEANSDRPKPIFNEYSLQWTTHTPTAVKLH
jgi:hypothetical protein